MLIKDKDLGDIKLVKNMRVKRIIVRQKDGYLQLTYPPTVGLSYIEKTIEDMKPRLLKLVEKKNAKHLFTPFSEFRTHTFDVKLIESVSINNFYLNLKDGILFISCPVNTDYKDPSVQTTIRGFIENALRYESKRILPQKVDNFAKQYGFIYREVKINKSRTRWGSCSSKKVINLSYYCLFLPEHLIDFVILHELSHTIEMNHGEGFWKLLDSVSGGKAKELTQELKSFKTEWR